MASNTPVTELIKMIYREFKNYYFLTINDDLHVVVQIAAIKEINAAVGHP